ncbi:retrovirus-related pol polyprotein from transposon TNT 1-94 [Tanacetum coccineum]|uniref:Retrovirus-related pol polyprotein from transposon TNT 1-94 n=1 Tax=Tanacetum coccineum TaxID=301880 RepID=A0ABQ5BPT0_9ASTR
MQNLVDSSDTNNCNDNMELALLAKAFKVAIPFPNKQQPKKFIQTRASLRWSTVMQMVDENVGNQVRHNAVQYDGNEVGQNAVQDLGHYAKYCIVMSRKRETAYLQQQLQIAREEEAGIQSTQEEFEFMTAADAHEEIKRVKVNCTSEDTLQQASTSRTHSNNAPIYDSDRSAEVPKDENCYDHDIFNMLTQEVQYTDLQTELDPKLSPDGFFVYQSKPNTATLEDQIIWSNSKPDRVLSKSKLLVAIEIYIENDKSKFVCAMCKQCLIIANHDVCVLNYVNGMTAHGYPNLFMVRRIGLLQAYDRESKASYQFLLKFIGTIRFGNDHVAVILEVTPSSYEFVWSNENRKRLNGKAVKVLGDVETTRITLGVGISHQASSVRTPQQNGVVERQNRTLVEAARTMLIFSRAPLFLWAEAIATAKLDISFLYVFGALCYPKNDQEDIRKLCAKGDIGFFIGYSANSSMYDDYRGGQPSTAPRTVPAAQNIDELETQQQHAQHQPKVVADNVLNAMFDGNVFVNPFAPPSISDIESSSLLNVDPLNMHTFYQSYPHEYQWTKDHPLKQVIGEPSRSVLTRNQLRTDGDMCMYTLTMSTMEPSSVKESMQDPTWIESMQEELL